MECFETWIKVHFMISYTELARDTNGTVVKTCIRCLAIGQEIVQICQNPEVCLGG